MVRNCILRSTPNHFIDVGLELSLRYQGSDVYLSHQQTSKRQKSPMVLIARNQQQDLILLVLSKYLKKEKKSQNLSHLIVPSLQKFLLPIILCSLQTQVFSGFKYKILPQ